jgi:hypothetical protein
METLEPVVVARRDLDRTRILPPRYRRACDAGLQVRDVRQCPVSLRQRAFLLNVI